MTVLDYLLLSFTIAGGILGAQALWRLIVSWFNATAGRRNDHYRRLRLLSTNVQVAYLSSVLGQSPAMRMTRNPVELLPDKSMHAIAEFVWVDRDYYVSAIAADDERVLAFCVVTRSVSFRPTFSFPNHRWSLKTGTLLKTTFASAARSGYGPDVIASTMGAHDHSYFESYYLGNPGFYQSFVLVSNEAGAKPVVPAQVKLGESPGLGGNFNVGAEAIAGSSPLQLFRASSSMNGYAVYGPMIGLGVFSPHFWPNYNELRVLP